MAEIDFPKLWEVLSEHFQLGPNSLHGPDHWERVEANGRSLAETNEADEIVVRLFAVFHDSERHNESTDPQHGQRASDLAEDLHGDLFEVSDERLELLCYACEYHHQGMTSEDATVGTCWDADRLDLPRVGIWPTAELMSTAEGKRRAR